MLWIIISFLIAGYIIGTPTTHVFNSSTPEIHSSQSQNENFGVSSGDVYIWEHEDGSTMKYVIGRITDTQAWTHMYNYFPSGSVDYYDFRASMTYFQGQYYSYDGYVWAIPINFTRFPPECHVL